MADRSGVRRAAAGVALLALLSAMHSVDAQRRSLPSRTAPIPDTETGGKVGSEGADEPPAPKLMIYGPPDPPPAPPPAPIAAPPPVAAPAPAPPSQRVVAPKPLAPAPRAAAAVAPAPAGPPKLDAKLVEQIFSCLAPGLPSDWKRTWVVVSNSGNAATAKFYYSVTLRDEDAEELVPCNAQEITRRITGLAVTLPVDQQRWTSARLSIDSGGAYALNYDYAK